MSHSYIIYVCVRVFLKIIIVVPVLLKLLNIKFLHERMNELKVS